ncbi:hypothetical protein HK101_010140 [Irineochytrium annulatum]|nr:hypothetical protein HK101_010140 [Irineochytrium annulatum]
MNDRALDRGPGRPSHFFTDDALARLLNQCGDLSGGSLLLLGPPRSGRTSLLMQYALAQAERFGKTGLVILATPSKEKLSAERPCLQRLSNPPSVHLLRRIHLRYFSSAAAFRRFLGSLPTTEPDAGGTPYPPCCILVDDFMSLFSPEEKNYESVNITISKLRETVIRLRRNAGMSPSCFCHFVLVERTPDMIPSYPSIHPKNPPLALYPFIARAARWITTIRGTSPDFIFSVSESPSFQTFDADEQGFHERYRNAFVTGTKPLTRFVFRYRLHRWELELTDVMILNED